MSASRRRFRPHETRRRNIANRAPPMRAAANWVAMEPELDPPVLIAASKGTNCRICAPTQSLIAPVTRWLRCCSNAISALALAAQVMTPSARDGSKEWRRFTRLRSTCFMTIPVRGSLWRRYSLMPWQRSGKAGGHSTVRGYGGSSEKIGRSILWSIMVHADQLAKLARPRSC